MGVEVLQLDAPLPFDCSLEFSRNTQSRQFVLVHSERSINSKMFASSGIRTPTPWDFHPNAYTYVLEPQVLIEGSLTSLLFVHQWILDL